MFNNIRISTRLMAILLLVGLVPFTVLGVVSLSNSRQALNEQVNGQLESVRGIKQAQIKTYFAEREGDMGVLEETVNTLRQEAMNKLTAVREIKKGAVERYLRTVEGQSRTFSENSMVVNALKDFNRGYNNFRKQNNISTSQLNKKHRELEGYYRNEFGEQYRQQNADLSPPLKQMTASLSHNAIALQYQYIQANSNPLGSKHLLDKASDGSSYSKTHGKIHPVIRNYLEQFGYYDIFLVDAKSGNIVYSVYKELDFATSLLTGPYADTNFAEVFRKARDSAGKGEVVMTDFAQYTPSYEAPAGFVASPIFDGKKKVGVAVFQFPIDRLNAIMGERSGLGKTGETYLIGADGLMRSDSFLDAEHHSVAASFRDPKQGSVDTEAVRKVLAGETGTGVIMDYNNNPVLSAWTPVEVAGLKWGLLAEIDLAEAFSPVDASGEAYYAKYIEQYGYYDLFLINPDGLIFFTVAEEADYQTNLLNGPYKDSNLGKLFRQVVSEQSYDVVDFAPYAPSNDEPAAFIAQPVINDGKVEMVVALQLPLDAINNIMQLREGMGETGESYLIGPDKRMRSDSFLDAEGHSVKASFAGTMEHNGVDTEAANLALSGQTGSKIVIDYNGNPVLSAYAPIQVAGIDWAILVEMDESEAFASINHLQWIMGLVAAIGIAAIVAVALWFTRAITGPLKIMFQAAQELKDGDGDLTRRLPDMGQNELGEVATAFNGFLDKILSVIVEVKGAIDGVASASQQVSSTSQELSSTASQQASSVEETSSALEQMSANVNQNSDNAKVTSSIALKSASQAEEGGQAVKQTVTAMQDIAKQIGIIDDIAYKTNLLALNAAIEAARAGEHGRGFAVVADEVRKLAVSSQTAAQDIGEKAVGSVETAEKAGALFEQMEPDIVKTSDLVQEIASASDEQSAGVNQITLAVDQISESSQSNAAGSEQLAATAEELSAQSIQLAETVGFFKTNENITIKYATQAQQPPVLNDSIDTKSMDSDLKVG